MSIGIGSDFRDGKRDGIKGFAKIRRIYKFTYLSY